MRTVLPVVALVLAGTACVPRSRPPQVELPPRVSIKEATSAIPDRYRERDLWAEAVISALDRLRIHPDADAVCQVLAVIEQESGFKANPEVPNLGRLVTERLEASAKGLGPLGKAALERLLSGTAPGTKATFGERLRRVKTERDLDLVFRDLLVFYEGAYPTAYRLLDVASALWGRGDFAAQNPITTAGSMQVSVAFAVQLAKEEARNEDDVDEWAVRDHLYTREGGVYFGTARLLGFSAGYDAPLYRFADYNAGEYASRNAALQEQVATLTGRALALDGDLLIYEKDGAPASRDSNTLEALLAFRARYAPKLGERRLRRDVREEKTRAFEETDTWQAVRAAYAQVTQKPPVYARLPEVTLHSPKLSRGRTTAWFAKSVDRRYQRCRESLRR